MPVYVYRNLVTNETFEHKQSIMDDPLTVDPRTGDPVKRVIQPVGIAFRGSGFYVNDSKGGGPSTKSTEKKSSDSAKSESNGSSASASTTASAD
ncbi:MAG TPA: FmdB family transcriptional regulator [Trueperaceae bacterium]